MSFKLFLEAEKKEKMVFCDLDGVLCDFRKQFKKRIGKDIDSIPDEKSYDLVNSFPVDWWATMDWLPDGKQLWNYLRSHCSDLHILSAPTTDIEGKSIKGKLLWLQRQGITADIGEKNIILDQQKWKHVQPQKDCYLIDDRPTNIEKWIKRGGIGILHRSTAKTIKELKDYGI
jgi:hypothetical protein